MMARVESMGNSTTEVVNSFAMATVGLNVVLAGSMQLLWGMVNTIQILTHLPLLDITYPSSTLALYQIIIDVANFEITDSEALLNKAFNFQFDEDEGAFSDKFEMIGYEKKNMILNLGF
jgi:hypothetical protein